MAVAKTLLMNGEPSSDRPVVLITGASGLVGTRLIDSLEDSYQVVALDIREPAEPWASLIDFIECDLTKDQSVERALGKVRQEYGNEIASVIHLAAYYDFSGAPSPLYETLTVDGTRRLLRQLKSRFKVQQFVYSSTLLVMMPASRSQILDESSACAANWDYPASKLRAEAVIEEERGEIPTVILRIAGCYDEGGHSPPITQQIWRIREQKLESHFFPGDASTGQSFVHLDDVASCFRRVVDARESLGSDLFLIGEPVIYSYAELQNHIGELIHGHRWATMRIPGLVAKAGAWLKDRFTNESQFIQPWMIDMADAHYPISIDHARNRLGWVPEHRLITSLHMMIESLERDPIAWYRENKLPVPPRSVAPEYGGYQARVE